MKPLDQYPISFPYGATTDPYSASHPHRGDDRAAPLGTPINVLGTTIGFVGMTGLATGYHCHIQEWQTSKLNIRKPQNAFKGGTVIEVDPIGNTGDGSWGKYVTVKNGDGWNSSYCHMNTVNAKVGQVLKGEDMAISRGRAIRLLRLARRGTSEAQIAALMKNDEDKWLDDVYASAWFKAQTAKINAPDSYKPYAGEQLFTKG